MTEENYLVEYRKSPGLLNDDILRESDLMRGLAIYDIAKKCSGRLIESDGQASSDKNLALRLAIDPRFSKTFSDEVLGLEFVVSCKRVQEVTDKK